jgi:hypothetical protein
VTGLVAGPAAATPSAKLTYLRGPGAERCPDETELRKAVAARLGYDLFFPWATKTVVAEITKARRGFRGRIKIVDREGLVRGERALDATSEDCGDVMRALALAISIAVDDLDLDQAPAPPPAATTPPVPLTPEPPPPESALEPRPEPSAPDRPSRGGAPAPVPPARGGVSLEAWLTPQASVGVAPETSLGLVADVGARYGRVSIGAELRGDLPASGGTAASGRVQTYVLLGSIVPCFHAPTPLFVCAVVSAGTFQEQGTEIRSPRSGAAPFGAAGVRLGIERPISSYAFFLAHADGLATVARHTVQIDGQTAYTLPPFSASVGFGAGVHF